MKFRMKMLMTLGIFLVLIFIVAPVSAVKPAWNLASAEKIQWFLSGEVMKIPPYGSRDIPGSDEASKLIVNQPNGDVEAVITGVMKGLNPNTVYTVYLSNGYTKTYQRWSLVGTWQIEIDHSGSKYIHDVFITSETDTTFSGHGGWPSEANSYTYTYPVVGTKSGNGVTIQMVWEYNEVSYTAVLNGTIATDGTLSGTWTGPGQTGTWSSTTGAAIYQGTVGTGWSGLFTSTIQPFTFTTSEGGSASWHLNLRDNNFYGPGNYILSVWINEPGYTMLISDNFNIVVD